MTKSKFTPGPWLQSGRNVYAPRFKNDPISRSLNEADARLIAAAPDLLAALDELTNVLAFGGPIPEYASAAFSAGVAAVQKAVGDD